MMSRICPSIQSISKVVPVGTGLKLGENKPFDLVTTERSPFTEVSSEDISPVELLIPRPETEDCSF